MSLAGSFGRIDFSDLVKRVGILHAVNRGERDDHAGY